MPPETQTPYTSIHDALFLFFLYNHLDRPDKTIILAHYHNKRQHTLCVQTTGWVLHSQLATFMFTYHGTNASSQIKISIFIFKHNVLLPCAPSRSRIALSRSDFGNVTATASIIFHHHAPLYFTYVQVQIVSRSTQTKDRKSNNADI